MKNFAITTVAVVTLTIIASSAQAQSGYYGSYQSNYTSPYPTQYLPAPATNYGTGYSSSYCPNGKCGTGACANGQCPLGCCANGVCLTGQCANGQCQTGQCANGRCGTAYRGGYNSYPSTTRYPTTNRYGFGSMLGSWFGYPSRQGTICRNGRCTTPGYGTATPYPTTYPATYPSTPSTPTFPVSTTPANTPYYNSY
jgi:hypothetical protein